MAKQRLLTPGPTEVPEAALLSMARQVTHHRTPEFRGLLAEVFAGLKYVFATEERRAGADQFRHGGDGSGRGEPGATRRKGDRARVGQVRRTMAENLRDIWNPGRRLRGSLGRTVRGRPTSPDCSNNIPTPRPCSPRCWKPAPAWGTTSRPSAGSSVRARRCWWSMASAASA